ncbi:MAG TPA: cytochrome c [Polyangiaceae bacterium]|nr:cytochrome c [Polyangiaceae bacterium]
MNRNVLFLSTVLALVGAFGLTACGGDEEDTGSTTEGEGEGEGSGTAAVDTSLPGDPNAGEAIYGRICVACHAADGRGNGGMTGADFVGDETRLSKSNEQLLTSIRDGVNTGSTPMPAQGGVLSEEEMRDVLSYIRREFGGTTE